MTNEESIALYKSARMYVRSLGIKRDTDDIIQDFMLEALKVEPKVNVNRSSKHYFMCLCAKRETYKKISKKQKHITLVMISSVSLS